MYDSTLTRILNNHASLKNSAPIPFVHPWYSLEIDETEKIRKRFERRWQNTKLGIDRQIFREQRLVVINTINKAKEQYYIQRISKCSNHKDLFKIFERLLHLKGDAKLPLSSFESEFSARFNALFVKILMHVQDWVQDIMCFGFILVPRGPVTFYTYGSPLSIDVQKYQLPFI